MFKGKSVAVAIILLVVLVSSFIFVWLPYRARERRRSNEQWAAVLVGSLPSVQYQFHAKDIDRNGINDFWTADIAGLYQYGLIDRSLAEADAAPMIPLGPKPIPDNGHFIAVMVWDESKRPPRPFQEITDPKSGKVHNPSTFAFCVYPAEPGVSGNYIHIYSSEWGRLRRAADCPPPRNWPSNAELQNGQWSKWR